MSRTPVPSSPTSPVPSATAGSAAAAVSGPDLIDAKMKEFSSRYASYYPKSYTDTLKTLLEKKFAANGDEAVIKFFTLVADVATRRISLEEQRKHTNKARERIREYKSDAIDNIDPSTLGKEAFRIMPYDDEGSLNNGREELLVARRRQVISTSSAVTKGEAEAIKKGNRQSDVMGVRFNELDTPLRFMPTKAYIETVDEATEQVRDLMVANEVAMHQLIKKDEGDEIVQDFARKEAIINKGRGKFLRAGSVLEEVLSAPVKGLTRGILYDSDPYEDKRITDQRVLNRELAEGMSALYLSDKVRLGDYIGEDEILRLLANVGLNRMMTIEEFAKLQENLRGFKDGKKKIEAAEKERQEEDSKIRKRLGETSIKINKALVEAAKDAVKTEDDMKKFRFAQIMALAMPFLPIAILPHVLSFLSPFVNTDMAHAFGQIAASDQTGIFGQFGSAIHLDDAITWVLDNFPIISQFLDLISDITQSGIVQNTLGIIAPLTSSALPEIALGVGYSVIRTGTEVQHREGINKKVKDAKKSLKEQYAQAAEEFDDNEKKSAPNIAKARIETYEGVFKSSMALGFLVDLADRIPENNSNGEAMDLARLMKAVCGDLKSAKKMLKIVGIDIEDAPAPAAGDAPNPDGFVLKIFKKKAPDEILRAGAQIGDADIEKLAGLMYFIDREAIKEEIGGEDPTNDAEKKAQQELISKNYRSLHTKGAESVIAKRKSFVETMDFDAAAKEFNVGAREAAGNEGMAMMNHLFLRNLAEKKWRIDARRFDSWSRHEASGRLRAEIDRCEIGALTRGAHNTYNIMGSAPATAPTLRSGADPASLMSQLAGMGSPISVT